MSVKILIDSGSDITIKQAEEMGIVSLPIEVNFSGDTYMDGDNITAEEFYNKLAEAKELPKTTQINSYRFEEEFKKYTENGDEVIYLSLSSKISGTYNNARLTAEQFDGKVHVVDTMTATSGMRVLAEYALSLIQEGKPAKEIAEALEAKKDKVRVFAMIDTLKYLKMGGRISGAAAVIGNMMSIKPVIGVLDGEVKVVGKSVGAKKAFVLIEQLIKDHGDIDLSLPHCYVLSGTDLKNYNSFLNTASNIYGDNASEIKGYSLGATIGSHIGPGAVGVAYFAK